MSLPGLNGYEICNRLRARFGRELPLIFVSGERVEPMDRTAGLMLGADDYLVKPFDPGELITRLRRLLERGAPQRPRSGWLAALTAREREVLKLLVAGSTGAAIAEELVIAPKTVATHIQHVLTKLDVRSRAQAVAMAAGEHL